MYLQKNFIGHFCANEILEKDIVSNGFCIRTEWDPSWHYRHSLCLGEDSASPDCQDIASDFVRAGYPDETSAALSLEGVEADLYIPCAI